MAKIKKYWGRQNSMGAVYHWLRLKYGELEVNVASLRKSSDPADKGHAWRVVHLGTTFPAHREEPTLTFRTLKEAKEGVEAIFKKFGRL